MRYSWEIPYLRAILQTDEAAMHRTVYEAIEAMEKRRLTPVNTGEDIALLGAEAGLQNADCGTHREERLNLRFASRSDYV
jgi:hypothetical protein